MEHITYQATRRFLLPYITPKLGANGKIQFYKNGRMKFSTVLVVFDKGDKIRGCWTMSSTSTLNRILNVTKNTMANFYTFGQDQLSLKFSRCTKEI